MNVFSGTTEQFGQTRARERLIWSGRREPWPHPTGAVQGDVTTWTAEQLLASQWSLWQHSSTHTLASNPTGPGR